MDKLKEWENGVGKIVLNAPKHAAVEALRGDMGCSTFRERQEGYTWMQSSTRRNG